MATATDQFTVEFPSDYDARSEHETPSRGYLSEVVVRLEDGCRYQLFFMDMFRLQQELTDNIRDGQPYFSEPNLVVLPYVTTESVRQAVEGMVKEGLLQDLKPL